jgi:hypothetical protein
MSDRKRTHGPRNPRPSPNGAPRPPVDEAEQVDEAVKVFRALSPEGRGQFIYRIAGKDLGCGLEVWDAGRVAKELDQLRELDRLHRELHRLEEDLLAGLKARLQAHRRGPASRRDKTERRNRLIEQLCQAGTTDPGALFNAVREVDPHLLKKNRRGDLMDARVMMDKYRRWKKGPV